MRRQGRQKKRDKDRQLGKDYGPKKGACGAETEPRL